MTVTGMRAMRMNIGPSVAAAHRITASVSTGSAGTITGRFAIARSHARSSIEWCVGPSSP